MKINRGSRRLAAAILVQAIEDLLRGFPSAQREALNWIREGTSGVFTFQMCCSFLNRDPDTVRNRLLAEHEKPLTFTSNWYDSHQFDRVA